MSVWLDGLPALNDSELSAPTPGDPEASEVARAPLVLRGLGASLHLRNPWLVPLE